MNFVTHMAYLVVCVLAMYLALIINKMIVGCCLLLQEMALPPIMNTNFILSSRSLAQSTSQYSTIAWGGNLLNCNLIYKVLKNVFDRTLMF